MFGPTSWVFLAALVAGFAALLCWLVQTSHLWMRIAAGVVALAVGTLIGASLVNESYAYYTTWGSLFGAMTGSGVTGYQPDLAPQTPEPGHAAAHDGPPAVPSPDAEIPTAAATVPASVTISPIDLHAERTTGTGRVVRLDLPGQQSRLTRVGYVYLPPQYFQPAYANVSFPVLELLHGDPGEAAGWLYGLNLAQTMDQGINAGVIGPMVVVMPTTFSGKHGQDCVDAPTGQQDDTYLSVDVPDAVARDFRVLPQGEHWGIGGLSDGGFCAANLALRHPDRYGAVASMAGFYTPAADAGVFDQVFGKDSAGVRANDPSVLATDPRHSLPRFWLMSGTANSTDTRSMESFRNILTAREPIESVIVHGGRHTTPAWRVALPSLLAWSWDTLSGGPVGTETTTLTLFAQPPPTRSPSNEPAMMHGSPTPSPAFTEPVQLH